MKLSLFIADLIQAVGTVLDIKWINEGKVHIGSFCTAQGMPHVHASADWHSSWRLGVIQQLGETPVAMNTLVCLPYDIIKTATYGFPAIRL